MNKVNGSCLCSSVKFECANIFSQFHLCHCVQCQKATGSAHASNLFTAPSNITWLENAHLVKRYDVPGRSISNAFCIQCGSALPYVSCSGKSLVVPAGCLDTPPAIAPSSNIFASERTNWYDIAITTKRFNGFPD